MPPQRRFGWEIRAGHIYDELSRRMDATVMHRPALGPILRRTGMHPLSLLPGASVAATTLMPARALAVAHRLMRLEVMDFHDDAVLQRRALGFDVSPGVERAHQDLLASHLEAFRSVAVPTAALADAAGIPRDQRIVVPNGTDSSRIRPGPWPSAPVVAMVSGGAPGRGIEMLIEAVQLVRAEHPEVTLRLALAASDGDTDRYIQGLRRRVGGLPWLWIGSIASSALDGFLADATVVAVPHPPGSYMDLALPIKLFDAMAAGRPVCVTPRSETAAVVRRTRAGVVAASDRAKDFAAALSALVGDEQRSRDLGRNGRRAVVEEFDWKQLSTALADEVLRRLG